MRRTRNPNHLHVREAVSYFVAREAIYKVQYERGKNNTRHRPNATACIHVEMIEGVVFAREI